MAGYDQRWLRLFLFAALVLACLVAATDAGRHSRSHANLTACQHLRRSVNRRSKTFRVRVPRCDKSGRFEEIQCMSAKRGEDCWCVDEYGVEIPGTRNASKKDVQCREPENCPASACRMFCPSGFARDPETGCTQCRCRDPCEGHNCPNGQSCQLVDVKCKSEPCPPVPTCKKARSLGNFCPAGLPLAIEDGSTSMRPFLCGLEDGKPQCPPVYKCMVEGGNDYGVCCPSALRFNKPGVCPAPETEQYSPTTGHLCGTPCTHDLECPNMAKCCFTSGCQYNCQQPHNVTNCQQVKAMSEMLSVNEREGRGYVPDCSGPNSMFAPRQCSRNGLVCWCVDPRTGHKISGSMGAATTVNCEGWENMISRSEMGRSFSENKCDTNICAAVCEYGFKNDHNNCPTCECSEPCDGFKCPIGSQCEVATDPMCKSGSALCASWPICKPTLAYSNPCAVGTPLVDNVTSEVMFCHKERQDYGREIQSFFDAVPDATSSRSMSNKIICPSAYVCTKLRGEAESVCCPSEMNAGKPEGHQQTMCEYLRDFSQRMEGTEEGMKLALPTPRCTEEGNYESRQCTYRKIKVTRAEQRKILEENTIRRMRMLLASNARPKRSKRDTERLKLYRVDDSLLKVQVAAPVMGRNAKVIDMGPNREQSLVGQLFETDFKKVVPAPKRPVNDEEIIELDVEECWCVDNFGTEIPRSRGFNVTDESCDQLRNDIDCLDLTCRMGCEYGFNLDPITRCPACQCRDPCQDVLCGDNEECRIVEVSCDEEYCAPVPACLARKPGQCPYLVPPGPDNVDTNACAYECRTDSHCEGAKRCCSNGCGTQCVLPQMKTACQHLQAIQMHQSSELGIPVKKMNISLCDLETGEWKQIQCSPNGFCWCVNEHGQELNGTRVKGSNPVCVENSAYQCQPLSCKSTLECEAGYKVDENGCQTCECRDFCAEINCAADEDCQLINVECVDKPCPKMPICVPRRESVCPEGVPLKQSSVEVSCGPHSENDSCPSSHTCQLNPVTNRGVCCTKTRDVCFESMDHMCLAKESALQNATRYRFNPKANRCVAVTIDLQGNSCQTKNLFHSETACNSVCPALTQCERLKLKNTLAAQRTGHSSVWFKPRCDPITGHWSPVQCLGKQPDLNGLSVPLDQAPSPYGVCWCADKKGAPLKGSLTRDIEPVCNSRQGRRFMQQDSNEFVVMEELIRQMTVLTDFDNFLDSEEEEERKQMFDLGPIEARAHEVDVREHENSDSTTAATSMPSHLLADEHRVELANSLLDSQLVVESVKPIRVKTTRCRSLAQSAPFPVSCDENGAFSPIQCNKKYCWCVDSAGNQLDSSPMFEKGEHNCTPTPISKVIVEMHLQNNTGTAVHNIYDAIRNELTQLLGRQVENLRVQEFPDGTALVHFELHDEDKIDVAFAIETTITSGDFKLAGGHYSTDITRTQFIHRREELPTYAKVVTSHEGTIQLVLFITATSTTLLICVFVVYIMLKRGKEKVAYYESAAAVAGAAPPPYHSGKTSLALDPEFASPIFVLSPEHDLESIRPPLENIIKSKQQTAKSC
uniref:Thyroglobulin type-1 domain-containing protein n=1 Tax=Stomoxys calcitrans TaxID=35570 RepID=A0A1I8PSF0_STOCA